MPGPAGVADPSVDTPSDPQAGAEAEAAKAASAASSSTGEADDTQLVAAGSPEAEGPQPIQPLLHVPGVADPFVLTLYPGDCLQDVRQFLQDLPESSFLTSFHLALSDAPPAAGGDGSKPAVPLNDFIPVDTIPGLVTGSHIHVVPDSYTEIGVRTHVKRLNDLLRPTCGDTEGNAAWVGPENFSPSFVHSVAKPPGVKAGGRGSKKAGGPLPASLGASVPRLGGLIASLPSAEEAVPMASRVTLSRWNPPRDQRRLQGDLAYLRVRLPESNKDVHVTAHTDGFYVNRSTASSFDHREHQKKPCHSHDLLGLLCLASPAVRANWESVVKPPSEQQAYRALSSPYRVVPWCTPAKSAVSDNFAAGCDGNTVSTAAAGLSPAQPRDWNEELQSLREMPRDTMAARLLRDRALFKFNSDFAATARHGAMEVVNGNVMSLNPADEPRSQMFIWNNIFFSFAVDSRDHYLGLGGDEAAHSAAGNDLHGVAALELLDLPDLCSLATAIVDYQGLRVVAQSIVPGILRREQQGSAVIYGSVDLGKSVANDGTMPPLLEQLSAPLHTKQHAVRDAEDQVHTLPTSCECKGILGSDGRHYLLDLFRLTPADANFVGDNGEGKAAKPVRHRMYVLRSELVQAYVDMKTVEHVRDTLAAASKEQEATEAVEAPPGNEDGSAAATTAGETTNSGAVTPSLWGKGKTRADFQKQFQFNADAYTSAVLAGDADVQAADRAEVKQLAVFLTQSVVPRLAAELVAGRVVPMDGTHLTDILHVRGINMRYLGLLRAEVGKLVRTGAASTAPAIVDDDHPLMRLCFAEMVARAAKHVLRHVLRTAPRRFLGACVAHFLTCLLGTAEAAAVSAASLASCKTRGVPTSRVSFPALAAGEAAAAAASMTKESLWNRLQETVQLHFQHPADAGPDAAGEPFSSLAARLEPYPLLRAVCAKVGVQVVARDYDFGGASPVFTADDIAGVLPVVKHTEVRSRDGQAALEAAMGHISKGQLQQGYRGLEESLARLNQIHGPLHTSLAMCSRQLALIMMHANEPGQAADSQTKATVILERTLGFDHPEVVRSYVQLASFQAAAGSPDAALRSLRHARDLIIVAMGASHTELCGIDTKMAAVLLTQGDAKRAKECLEKTMAVHGAQFHSRAMDPPTVHELLARCEFALGNARGALEQERLCNALLAQKHGEADARTAASKERIAQYTQVAVKEATAQRKMQAKATTGGGGEDKALRARRQKVANVPAQKKMSAEEDTRPVDDLLSFINGDGEKRRRRKPKVAQQ